MGRIRQRPRRAGAMLLMTAGLIGLFLSVIWLLTATRYTVYADDEVVAISGSYGTVEDVLAAAGVAVQPADIVHPPLTAPPPEDAPIQIQRAVPVLVRTEDGEQTHYTHQTTLGAFLTETGIDVGRTDQIFADQQQVTFGDLNRRSLPREVEIGRFVTVTIADGASERLLRTAADTVGAALREADITYYAADNVTPPPGTWLAPDMVIRIERSRPLTIRVDGRVIQTRSYHDNAHDVLAELGIGLVGYDYTRPGPGQALRPGDTIEVVRVTEDFRVVDEPIPFETQWQGTDQLVLDQQALLQAGEAGIARTRMRVRYENGAEVSQTPDGQWVAKAPVPEIMGYGTRVEIGVVDTPQGPREYWRVVRMRVTSYTAASSGKARSHPAYGITASGLPAGTGIVAIDRSVVPWLSEVYVPNYGVGLAGDTGGGVRGRWIDLGYDENEYVSWSGYVDVYYLTPVPEQINYRLPRWLP